MIVLRNKTFSSAKQKALRKAFDLQKGLASKKGEVISSSNKIGDVMDGIRGLGRRENQVITRGKGVNASINTKAERFGSQATRVRNPESVSREVNDLAMKGDKITRHSKISHNAEQRQSFYDHGYGTPSINGKKFVMKSKRAK